ncbi:capsid protein VP2 [Archaeoglobales archaeon]|nr:MAG: capsid protein VP2 [Archaeoglobales archaeon]RLI80030.1 MAG: capsid protein VP2 [Archaeoglobales archaeon]
MQKAIKRPGRVKRFLARKYGKEAFTKSGEIKQQYVIKAISDVKRTMPPGKKRRSLLAALNLAKRLETIGRGKRGK